MRGRRRTAPGSTILPALTFGAQNAVLLIRTMGRLSSLNTVTISGTTRAPGSLLPHRVGRVLVGVTWLAVVESVATQVPHPSGVKGLAAWAGTIGFLIAFPLAYERTGPAVVSLAALGAVVISFTVPGNASLVATISTVAIAGVRLSPGLGRSIAVFCGVGFLSALILTAHSPARDLVSAGSGVLFTYLAADALRRLRDEQQRTRALLQEVIEGRDARIRAAALDERARLAREMHDILAHTLAALAIQLEGARMLAEQRPGDPALVENIERAGRLAREGLEEARRAVGSLRGDTLPGPDLLPALAKDFERDTGVHVRVRIEGTPRELSPDSRLALYRVAQEALTNVRKHAEASCVDLDLRYAEGAVELSVGNDGRTRLSPVAGGGFGLNGMRERAELLGGRLEAGPHANGFRVYLWIPT